MKTVLAIFGGIFLSIIVLLLLLAVYFWRKFTKIKQYIGRHERPPLKIHLNEDIYPEWTEEALTKSLIHDFEEIGFKRGKAYLVVEMPQMKLVSLFNTDPAVCAVIYQHETAGRWVDLSVPYQDGTLLSVSNAPHSGKLDYPPYYTKILNSEASIAELCQITLDLIAPKPIIPLNDQNFREYYETCYQRDMEWRAQRRSITPDEFSQAINTLEDALTIDPPEDELIQAKLSEITIWHSDCLDQFIEEADDEDLQEAYYNEELFIISDVMHPEAMIEYISRFFGFSEAQAAQYHQFAENTASITELFAAINGSLSPELRAIKAGAVAAPIAADVYHLPADESEQ